MTKTKAQLRREAVERLKDTHMDSGSAVKKLAAAIGSEWNPPSVNYSLGCLKSKLIDLLTDEEPRKFGVTAEQMAKASADFFDKLPSVNGKKADSSQDSREKLEAEIRYEYNGSIEWEADQIIEWLDRQAAITEREYFETKCYDCQDAHDRQTYKNIERYAELKEQLDTMRDVARKFRDERDELQERVDNLCASEKAGDKLIIAQLETEAEQGRTIVEYAEKVDGLEAENAKLKEELRLINTYSGVKGCECETTVFGMKLDDVRGLKAENEQLREKLSRAYDNAHDTLRMMD